MKNSKKIIFSLSEVPGVVATHIIPHLGNASIVTLAGPLGAGKTTLVKEVFKQIGISDVVTSPTFSYVNSYKAQGGKTVHHFDLYRLTTFSQFASSGFDEYFSDKDAIVFIEWPEVIELFLQHDYAGKVCQITLAYLSSDPGLRELKIAY
jgi:tRNA threonylcarbamoyladenosine biosynthesis protein TsaE